ncbi:hypothetical protein JCM8097_005668 [Rhodosporidiobolus ruineniae]
MPPSLTDEPLTRILRLAHPPPTDPADRDAYELRRDTLAVWRRVSKRWKRIIEPLLWESVRIEEWDFGDYAKLVEGGAARYGRHVKKFKADSGDILTLGKALRATPNLISLEVVDFLEMEEPLEPEPFERLQYLESLVLDHLEIHICPDLLPTLTSLSLVRVNCPPETLSLLLDPEWTPSLRSVLLSSVRYPIEWERYDLLLRSDSLNLWHLDRLEVLQLGSGDGQCDASSDFAASTAAPVLVSYEFDEAVPRLRPQSDLRLSPRINEWGEFSDEEPAPPHAPRRRRDKGGVYPAHLHLVCPGVVRVHALSRAYGNLFDAVRTSSNSIESIWLPDASDFTFSPMLAPVLALARHKLEAMCHDKGVHLGHAPASTKVRLVPEFARWAREEKAKTQRTAEAAMAAAAVAPRRIPPPVSRPTAVEEEEQDEEIAELERKLEVARAKRAEKERREAELRRQ